MFEENQNGKNASENNRKTLVPEDEGTREISSLSEEKPKDSFDRLGELLNKACETVSLIREKCEKAEKIASDTNTSLRNEIEILQRKQEELLQQKEVLSAKLNDANKLVDSLHARVYELERTSEELKSTIEKNKEEIDQRDQMIEALSRDRSKQTYEQANRLASQLKVEYDDFKSAENSEMSTELGENMREQLKNIFDILAKSGITLS
jgi:septal ring factor EnvC (AmiA/AmiB activator)